MHKYIIRKSAEDDLEEITTYTQRMWGIKQRDEYLLRLERKFEYITAHPHLGKKCDYIRKGYFSIREGRRIIFYKKGKDQVEIAHVVHEKRNLKLALQPKAKKSSNKNKSHGMGM